MVVCCPAVSCKLMLMRTDKKQNNWTPRGLNSQKDSFIVLLFYFKCDIFPVKCLSDLIILFSVFSSKSKNMCHETYVSCKSSQDKHMRCQLVVLSTRFTGIMSIVGATISVVLLANYYIMQSAFLKTEQDHEHVVPVGYVSNTCSQHALCSPSH